MQYIIQKDKDLKSEGKVKRNGQGRLRSNIYLIGFVGEKKCRRENSHIKTFHRFKEYHVLG